MAIKVIVELQAKSGRRDELRALLERMVASDGPSLSGFLGSTRYEVLDVSDMLIEIAEWEFGRSAPRTHGGGCRHRGVCTSAGDAVRTIQGNGHQAAAVTHEWYSISTG